jgi:protein-S-isoprenylcysteine O-methyltransferase Ste14
MFEFENSLARSAIQTEHQNIAFGFICCIFVAGLVASVIAVRTDKRDWTRLHSVQNEEVSHGL